MRATLTLLWTPTAKISTHSDPTLVHLSSFVASAEDSFDYRTFFDQVDTDYRLSGSAEVQGDHLRFVRQA
jgi:hypothetical protein